MGDYNAKSDEELLVAWRSGDRRAGACFFERYYSSIARFFVHRLGSDCDDLIQATFLALLEQIGNFRGESSCRTWLFAVARKKLYKHLREVMRDRERFDPRETSIASLQTTPTQKIAARDDNHLLLAALRELPLDTQMMFELHYWESMNFDQIARILEIPKGTIKSRMHRARRQLESYIKRLANSPQELKSTLDSLSKWAARLREDIEADGVDH